MDGLGFCSSCLWDELLDQMEWVEDLILERDIHPIRGGKKPAKQHGKQGLLIKLLPMIPPKLLMWSILLLHKRRAPKFLRVLTRRRLLA